MPLHTTRTPRNDQDLCRENPQFEFREQTVPGPWLEKLCRGEVSRAEFLLVLIVDSLNVKGHRCYASNAYLGRALGIAPQGAHHCVRKMVAEGYLTREMSGETRYLSVNWTEILNKRTLCWPDTGGVCRQNTPEGIPSEYRIEEGNADTPAALSATPRKPSISAKQTPTPKPLPSPPKENTSVSAETLASELGIPDKPKVTPIDEERAKRLRRFCLSKGSRCRAARYYEQPLAKLRRMLGDAEGEIDRVVDWVISTDPPKPRIRCGEQLYKRWDWLCRILGDQPMVVEVSSEAKRIADKLTRVHDWGTLADQLPAAIQLAVDSVSALRVKAKRLSADNYFAQRIARNLGDPYEVAERWFDKDVMAIVRFYRVGGEFRGRLANQIPSLDNPRFVKYLLASVGDGIERFWPELEKELRS